MLKIEFKKKLIKIGKFKRNNLIIFKHTNLYKIKKSIQLNAKNCFLQKLNIITFKKKFFYRITSVCLESGHYRSVSPFFGLKRQSFVEHAKLNNVPNIRKSYN